MAKSKHHKRRRDLLTNLVSFFTVHLIADAAIPRSFEQGRASNYFFLGLLGGAGIYGMVRAKDEALASASAAVALTAAIRTFHAITNQLNLKRSVTARGDWVGPGGTKISISEIPPLHIPNLK